MEVDSSTGGWSWQLELAHPQITLPQQQDSLPMSIDPLGGGGGEDEEEWISLLRSCPLRSPPRSLLPFSPASPPDIWVTPWDPYTWIPPCSHQIEQAVALIFARLHRQLRRLKMQMEIPLRRPKRSVIIQYNDDDDNTYDVLTVVRKPYGPNDFLKHFKSKKDGELKYCIHCNDVFPSDTDLFDLSQNLRSVSRISIQEVYPPPKSSGGIPDMETALKLTEGSSEGNILLSGNEKPKEIDAQKSASRHVESPVAFDQSNTPPERMLVDNGEAAASTDASWIDAVQNCFEETTKADKPKGTLKKKWSAVWEHFVETIIDDTVWADCKHCKKRFAGGTKKAGTSTLRRHLDKLHGIETPKASSSSKNENLCGVPATSKSKTPTPSLLPSLEPVASEPPGKTTQRKKTTDGVNDLATQEVCARGKRTRRRDNPSSSGVTPSEVPSSASAAPPPTVGHAAEATSTGMVVASSQIALSAAGASGEVVRSIADTIINPGPKDLTNAILLMSQAAEAVAREKMLLQEMEKLRQENTDQATAVHSRLEALEAKLVLAADENKKLKAENTALRSQPQESPHSRPASPPSKRS